MEVNSNESGEQWRCTARRVQSNGGAMKGVHRKMGHNKMGV